MSKAPDTPAKIVIEKCGGANAVAEMCGIHVSRVYRWTHSRAKGGTGGHVPARHQDQILRSARLAGKDLTPADFFVAEPTCSSSLEGAAA